MLKQQNIQVRKLALLIMFQKNSMNQKWLCNKLYINHKQKIHFQDIYLRYKNNKKHLLIQLEHQQKIDTQRNLQNRRRKQIR
ncbi:unnamed protein product [Paramecium pentaurelia]|uniref:Uncharacterized protein n=1 Tax=Paramecium pentaurelia TaxID=43138 RepID=A0A8S1WN40_9CILI|nr:unnamed protein product [Paramecium pentaurelia]